MDEALGVTKKMKSKAGRYKPSIVFLNFYEYILLGLYIILFRY